jgi:hypothetical protein
MRAHRRPAPSLAGLTLHQHILLAEIEARIRVRRIGLLCRQLDGADMGAVPLQTVHELDMPQGGRNRQQHIEQVPEHLRVGVNADGIALRYRSRTEKHMCRVRQLVRMRLHAFTIEQISRDVTNRNGRLQRSARQRCHLPVRLAGKPANQIAAKQSGTTDDEGLPRCHLRLMPIILSPARHWHGTDHPRPVANAAGFRPTSGPDRSSVLLRRKAAYSSYLP